MLVATSVDVMLETLAKVSRKWDDHVLPRVRQENGIAWMGSADRGIFAKVLRKICEGLGEGQNEF